ncbi:hypothetical protein [Paraburkholderia largidicola]|jgi:hypothetical protein|uniref:Uncharacterized protein n=1 Tax=Paraburkholderia largidicola TaxID=3014751 RepID=A0A7I8C0Z7_9BURK|nr:hypothetical protein [Paraburkholderia sp. PGU16]BCF94746.1 hypothetical protein PPGU16_78130 [Paraburkholderia sp. PGU16]
MHESWVSMLMGLAVLLFAVVFMVGHYRLEHRRAQLPRQMDRTYHGHRPRNRRSMCDPADPQNNNTNATGKAYER